MKHTWRMRIAACGLLGSILACSVPVVHATGTDASLTAVNITSDDRSYTWLDADTETYTYDFTATDILTYSRDEKLANLSLRTNMVFDGETLSCKPGKSFSFGSAIFLGDDYGIRGGELSFDLAQTGGKLAVGLRLEKKAAKDENRGIWFTFDGAGNMTVASPESELSATLTDVSTTARLTFRDTVDEIRVLAGESTVAVVRYDSYKGAISVCTPNGTVLDSVITSTANPAGYFTLFADSMAGTIDNLSFTHTALTRGDRVTNAPVVDYSNWVATDDRDREVSTADTVGKPREGKQVGLFYFVNHTGTAIETPLDNTHLYNTLGLDGMKAYLEDLTHTGAHYWAEPYFGYYMNTDSWVQRKHAYMLEAAGVDFIFVDVSNGATYDPALISLFDTWSAIRAEGGSTPDICFLAAGNIRPVWNSIHELIYGEAAVEKYGELFYQYDGKPLLLCDLSEQTDELKAELTARFTIRHCWAWSLKPGQWNWLQEYTIDKNGNAVMSNGTWGLDEAGNPEQLALCMGHHPTTSKGRSFVNGKLIFRDDYGFGLDSGAGAGFASSFEAIKQFDPDMLLITGWNEWTAGLKHETVENFAGTQTNEFYFVDQFNTEYSRDGEPMKLRDGDGVGFGDNYYYQMASYIRQFKGWTAAAPASGQTTVRLDDPTTWESVGPTFTDTANDTAWRSHAGYFGGYTYVNNSGRNDLLTAKVSQDAEYLYFTVQTAEDVIISDDSDWMNLYIDLDSDNATGWEGFDLVLNRARDGHYVSVESLAGGWAGQHIGQALYTVSGNTFSVRLSKALVGIEGTATELLFKWADNATVDGHIMEFMDKGDTAPNDRYAFRYTCAAEEVTDTQSVRYTLRAADGTAVELRDEATLLPGISNDPPVTEPETAPETVPETIPESVPESIPETVPGTTPETIPETIPETAPMTQSATITESEPPVTTTPTIETTPTNEGGCSSTVSGHVGLPVACMAAATILLLRRRKKIV